ncbi:MAG: hypothetical protein WBG46_06325 [Nonlabens sp.]
MLYLGDQLQALKFYQEEAICLLKVKIHGRSSIENSDCSDELKSKKRHSGLTAQFRGLFDDGVIETLVTAKPDRLLEIHNDLKLEFVNVLENEEEDFIDQCKKLFVKSGYRDWFIKFKVNYKIAKIIDFHSCTYCNREYAMTYRPDGHKGKAMVPQFDHWYPKASFPLLALSFYNLIPSCATCNTIKSKIDMDLDKHLHPYMNYDISGSYKFDYLLSSTDQLRINFMNKRFDQKSIDTINALNLPMIYDGHNNKELKDLYDLRYKYSDNYLNILLKDTFRSNLPITDEEKYRLIFGIELDEKNYHKRIMSKFKSDIIKKLLAIKV